MNNTNPTAATLNIGHNIPERHNADRAFTWDSFTIITVLERITGKKALGWSQHWSSTEATTVVALAEPLTAVQATLLSQCLLQDAIVQYVHGDTGASALYGEKAAEWGAFDPCEFILLDGSKLAAAPESPFVAVAAELNVSVGRFNRHTFTIKSGRAAGTAITLLVTKGAALDAFQVDYVDQALAKAAGCPVAFLKYTTISHKA